MRALLAVDPLADQLIESLTEKGIVKRENTGKLKIKRKVFVKLKISI
jgi:hypothetical protein